MNSCPGPRRPARPDHRSRLTHPVGVVAVVHPRLSDDAARALESAGFARLADTGRFELWVRHPRAQSDSSEDQIPDQKEST